MARGVENESRASVPPRKGRVLPEGGGARTSWKWMFSKTTTTSWAFENIAVEPPPLSEIVHAAAVLPEAHPAARTVTVRAPEIDMREVRVIAVVISTTVTEESPSAAASAA